MEMRYPQVSDQDYAAPTLNFYSELYVSTIALNVNFRSYRTWRFVCKPINRVLLGGTRQMNRRH